MAWSWLFGELAIRSGRGQSSYRSTGRDRVEEIFKIRVIDQVHHGSTIASSGLDELYQMSPAIDSITVRESGLRVGILGERDIAIVSLIVDRPLGFCPLA